MHLVKYTLWAYQPIIKWPPLEGYKRCGVLLFMALAYDLFMIAPLAYKGLVTPFQVVPRI